MTTSRSFLIGTFVFIAAVASAQEPGPFPAPAQPPLPAAPAVPATADLARPASNPSDRKKVATAAFAQAQKKAAGVAAAAKVEPNVFFWEPGASESWYSQARAWIDRDQYDRALEPLDKVIGAKAARADAAMYWKAYSLLKLARRDEALSTLEQMQKQHPDSRWLRDARALEVEAKQAAGQSVATNMADDDVKLLALNGIMRTDPEAALPVVEKMLSGGGSVRLKERALFVLSQNKSDRAREIIGSVARGTSNPDLQLLAIRYLGVSSTPEGVAALLTVYRTDTSMPTRKAVVSALASGHNNPAATNGLITLARSERNPELRTLIVRHLSNLASSAPDARAYMFELLK